MEIHATIAVVRSNIGSCCTINSNYSSNSNDSSKSDAPRVRIRTDGLRAPRAYSALRTSLRANPGRQDLKEEERKELEEEREELEEVAEG